MLEPAHLLALAKGRVTGERRRLARAGIEHAIKAVQADAGHENRRNRNQYDEITSSDPTVPRCANLALRGVTTPVAGRITGQRIPTSHCDNANDV